MPQKQHQKRPSALEDPPTASSSSESEEEHQPPSQEKPVEEEASSEEASDSEEEDNDTGAYSMQPASKTPSAALTATNSHPKPSESESGTQSDSESDEDSDQAPPPTNTKVKPLATKPMDNTVKPKARTQTSPAPAKSAAKRAAENNTPAGDPKRAKKKGAASAVAGGSDSDEELDEDEKKSGPDSKKLFQRVWSVEDEIAILKGLGEFTSKTGNDPMKFPEAFYDYIKKSLNVDANSTQLRDKIRRMKKKFETQAAKGKNGEGPNFSKAHGQKSFELSKKLWGKGGANEAEEKPKSNGKPAKSLKSPKKEAASISTSKNVASAKKPKSETKQEQQSDDMHLVALNESAKVETEADTSVLLSELFRAVGVYGLGEDVAKRGLELIGASKRAELEGKWKKLKVAEMELFVMRAQLIEEQSRLVLEAYKSSLN